MNENYQRLTREIVHGQKIKETAEDIWGLSSPAGKIRTARRANYFLEMTKMNSHHKVLEIGCGSGIFSAEVSKTGASITATDISLDLLDIAMNKKVPNCGFSCQDAHSLSFSDDSFDVVFGSSILHHLDVEVAMQEIHRVLRKSGSFILSEPNMLNPQIFLQKNIPFIKRLVGDTEDETAFVRWDIYNRIKRLGFGNVAVFSYDFLHPSTPPAFIPLLQRIGDVLEKIPLLKEVAGSLIIYGVK